MINSTLYRDEEIEFSTCAVLETGDKQGTKCVFNSYHFVPINVLLFITSLLGNILILVALQKESSLHPPSKLLFRCLSCTDLLVALISQPVFVIYLIVIANKNLYLCRITEKVLFISSSMLCGESIQILTAIRVDRLLALLLKLRYRQVVTLTDVRFIVIFSLGYELCVWHGLFVEQAFFPYRVFCRRWNIISSFCYFKIYFTISRQQKQVQSCQAHPGASLNIACYKKTVSSALCIHFTLILIYLPHTIATLVTMLRGLSPCTAFAWNITILLIFLNSTLNPFLYCWKIRALRQAVKDTLKKYFYYREV